MSAAPGRKELTRTGPQSAGDTDISFTFLASVTSLQIRDAPLSLAVTFYGVCVIRHTARQSNKTWNLFSFGRSPVYINGSRFSDAKQLLLTASVVF